MYEFIIDVLGVLTWSAGWIFIIYAMWRNQRVAAKSPLCDRTNFGPRGGSIVEVVLHPDHAAVWLIACSKDEAELMFMDGGYPVYFKRVFPAIGQDSSEQWGTRKDDGKVEEDKSG